MKTLKKSLALALVLALVLSLGVVGASAASNLDNYTDADTIGADYAEAVDVMTGIGIIEGAGGTLDATGSFTREQAAKILTYMKLGPDAAEALTAGYAPFDDVAASRWSAPFIAYCKMEGILVGYGDGKFGPTDELTGYQWGKMLLCAVGYGVNGEYEGDAWAIQVAKDAIPLGVFDGDVSGATGNVIQRQQAILYAFNTLTSVYKVSYSELLGSYTVGGTIYGTVIGETLGESIYKLFATDNNTVKYGTVASYTGSQYYVFADSVTPANPVVINETDPALIHRTGYVWYQVDGSKRIVMSDLILKDTVLGTNNSGKTIAQLGDDSKSYYISGYDTTAQVYVDNAAGVDASTVDTNSTAAGDVVTFIDTDKDSKADVILIQTEDSYVVTGAPYTSGSGSSQDTTIPGAVTAKTNKLIAPDGLAKNDVVTVQLRADGKTYVELAKSVTGQLTNIVSGSSTTYTIEGESYKLGLNMVTNGVSGYNTASAIDSTYINKDGVYYFGTQGYIIGSKLDSTPVYNLAYVIGTDYTTAYGTSAMTAKLIFADGTISIVDVYKIGTTKVSNIASGDIAAAATALASKIVNYSSSSDGYTLTVKGGSAGDTYKYKTGDATLTYTGAGTGVSYVVDSKTIIFVKTTSGSYKAYVGVSAIPGLVSTTPYIYTNGTSETGAGLVRAGYFAGGTDTSTDTTYYGYIKSIGTSMSGSDTVTTLTIWDGITGSDLVYVQNNASSVTVAANNFISYTMTTDGKVDATVIAKTTANFKTMSLTGADNYVVWNGKTLPQADDVVACYMPASGDPYKGGVQATGDGNPYLAYVVYNKNSSGVETSVAQVWYIPAAAYTVATPTITTAGPVGNVTITGITSNITTAYYGWSVTYTVTYEVSAASTAATITFAAGANSTAPATTTFAVPVSTAAGTYTTTFTVTNVIGNVGAAGVSIA